MLGHKFFFPCKNVAFSFNLPCQKYTTILITLLYLFFYLLFFKNSVLSEFERIGINTLLMLKTDTQETENLDKAISLIKRVQACPHSS
jgi:hypothetical protein